MVTLCATRISTNKSYTHSAHRLIFCVFFCLINRTNSETGRSEVVQINLTL